MFLPRVVLGLVMIVLVVLFSPNSWALYQPWIAEQAARKTYQEKLATYSPQSQKKATDLASLIVEINKSRGAQMSAQMEAQAAILDEYQRRRGNAESDPKIEQARYWLTYAHEAVAFQEAKNYIFTLTQENNLKGDVISTVNQLKADLEATRKKVLNSQAIIQELVK